MTVTETLTAKLKSKFNPIHFEIHNESHMHSVPPGSESHFRVVIASASFEGLSRLERQRLVNEVVKEELASSVHAFTQRLMTPAEWDKVKDSFQMQSPPCHGGDKN